MEEQNSLLKFPTMKRVRQITSSHCGPAVLRMLLSHAGVTVLQKQIVEAAGIEHRVRDFGTTLEEMARAVANLKVPYELWWKMPATVDDIYQLVEKYKYPVGVEWQGLFGAYQDDDPGHYAVVVGIEVPNNRIWIADPYWLYAGVDRELKLSVFEQRWWDTNYIEPGQEERQRFAIDDKLAFVVTPVGEDFPKELGFERGSELIQKNSLTGVEN